jgi:hypothetical protein
MVVRIEEKRREEKRREEKRRKQPEIEIFEVGFSRLLFPP